MKIAYFDCFSGASGDMTLGALLACEGADQAEFRERLSALSVSGYELRIEKVKREGITATDVDVKLIGADQGHGRHLADITSILNSSPLTERVKQQSLAIFTRLAHAEAKIHGTSVEEIHFHEVGAVDAIVDIVGSCILLEMLGIDQVHTSSIPCGHGTIRCQHGIMPVPAPATMELLHGFPVRSVDIEGELVTPTGAAIITTLADPGSAGKMPDMRILANGFGAGKKQFVPDMPNLLRIVIGETDNGPSKLSVETTTILETNLDDERPETLGYLMERCLDAGAADLFFTPIQMKKNRPATMVSIICSPYQADEIARIVFAETGTFGIRRREQAKYVLERRWETVNTRYGEIRIKIGEDRGKNITYSPEFEDCRRAAMDHNLPLRQAYEEAVYVYRQTAKQGLAAWSALNS